MRGAVSSVLKEIQKYAITKELSSWWISKEVIMTYGLGSSIKNLKYSEHNFFTTLEAVNLRLMKPFQAIVLWNESKDKIRFNIFNHGKTGVTKENGLTQVAGINLSWDKLLFPFNPYGRFRF